MSLTSGPINESEAAAEKFGTKFFQDLTTFADHILDRLFKLDLKISLSERKE